MRIDRRFIGWGIFFIVAGAIPILVNQGLVEAGVARNALSLWPLFIVAIGLGLLLRESALDWVSGLVVAITAGLMAGSLLAAGGSLGVGICSGDATGTPNCVDGGVLTAQGGISVDLPCGELSVVTAAGSEWSVAAANGDGRQPRVTRDGDTIRVDSEEGTSFFVDAVRGRAAWAVTVPRDPVVDLDLSMNAGEATVDLQGAHLGELRLGMNAGSAHVDASAAEAIASLRAELNAGELRLSLPARSLTGRVEANAGSLSLCVAPGSGLRFRMDDNITASNNFAARGLVQSGDTWESLGIASAGVVIDLRIEANAASITLDPEGGC